MGQTNLAVFRERLHKLGWIEGRNIQIEFRSSGGDTELLQRQIKELVALAPDVIVSNNTPTTAALLLETRTVPVIFASVSDPVGSGFVTNFARPSGNATGFTNIEVSQAGKWVELLKEIAPHLSRVGFMFNPITAPYAEQYLSSFKTAAASFAVEAISAPVTDKAQLEAVFKTLASKPNGGLAAMTDNFINVHRAEITSLAARYRIPAVYPYRHFVTSGGLLSYGNHPNENMVQAATYVDRILRGSTPSELPVQAPVRFELCINLKTAQALGLDVPLLLQQRADEVIE